MSTRPNQITATIVATFGIFPCLRRTGRGTYISLIGLFGFSTSGYRSMGPSSVPTMGYKSDFGCPINYERACNFVTVFGLELSGTNMPRIRLLILFAAIYLCGSGFANAATDSTFRIFDWLGSASWNKQERQLDHCSAQLTNADKITIIYSLDRQYGWSLEISSPAWNFTKGASFPVSFKIGEHGYFRFRAVAAEANLVQVQLPDSLAVFDAFRRAIQLGFTAGGLTSHFDLTYGPQVLMALTKCVVRYGTSSQRRAEISAWQKSFADPKILNDASIHKEASDLAANVVMETQIPKASSLPQKDVPAGLVGDAFWKIGDIVFIVSILPQKEMSSFVNLPGLIIGSESAKCHGDLFSGAMTEVIAALRVARVITNCVTPQTATTTYYLVIPRKQGGVYLLATLTSGFEIAALGGPMAEEIDRRIRGSVNVALSKLNASK